MSRIMSCSNGTLATLSHLWLPQRLLLSFITFKETEEFGSAGPIKVSYSIINLVIHTLLASRTNFHKFCQRTSWHYCFCCKENLDLCCWDTTKGQCPTEIVENNWSLLHGTRLCLAENINTFVVSNQQRSTFLASFSKWHKVGVFFR
jgi:hypothetical protein